jgi:ABC-2 type transport system permease protein
VALFFNPEQRTAVNIVPGLVGVILTMTMIMFTSAAIVRERERGNMEMLINTPVRPIELMLGKIIPYIFIGLVQTTIILLLGHLIFGVPLTAMIAWQSGRCCSSAPACRSGWCCRPSPRPSCRRCR